MGMYESPIKIIESTIDSIYKDIVKKKDDAIFAEIQSSFGVELDRGELIRALRYDREQYDKGYADGKADANAELVRCKDCKHWHEETSWCTQHSHFIGFDGMACHPSQSSEWKMFDAEHFCKDGERKDNGSRNKLLHSV